ncbi:type II secretion system protein [Vibrio aquaticus]|uniref:Type II secretion system protein n=1 Tax=Vibrio aquaticus TaxID=2496559 RepID=A0A432CZP8_9VIBR|nr:prepilin-type N-terminal cleavage/methylation domain-containing protein [Vibrio aquaticus]RTZ16788.1 type II secretion system protein [Vibrio aquaticus]
MQNIQKEKGFTLIEMIIVIVLLAVLAIFAAPRFLNFASDSRTAAFETTFGNMTSAVQIYRGACLARGGDVVDEKGGRPDGYTQGTDVEGIGSNFTGSCFPVSNTKDTNSYIKRDINNPQACVELVETLTATDYFSKSSLDYPPRNTLGGSNKQTVSASNLQQAIDEGYNVFIHQRFNVGVSYCHYYQLDGDLHNASYYLYNAMEGEISEGRQDISNGFTWTDQLALY